MARPWVVEPWLARGERGLLVYYEELITNVRSVLGRIFEYLEVEAAPDCLNAIVEKVRADQELVDRHATAESPVHSIGRWRGEMSPEMRGLCNDEFRDFLETFHYPVA